MSNTKCPFCGKHIRYLGTDLFTCDACHIMLPAKHWLAYINTRKALEIAVDAIDEILYLDSGKFIQEPAEMWKIAKSAKDKITATLENQNGNC